MHGRLKVRTTAEEAARKQKEHEISVKKYRAGMSQIYEKRNKAELDNDMMTLTRVILLKNPDVHTLWNIRRECLKNLEQITVDNEDAQKMYDQELTLTENSLMVNPKSYGAWHHRAWVLENSPKPPWEKEVQICTKYLKLDERNFHCWDHRRFVVQKAGIPPEKELEFCTEKIKNNFSNYSSWHYRSKLLPILYPHETIPNRPISEEKLKEELELVLTATFTDPYDSSAWFYQRWLLGYSQPALDIAAFRISRTDSVISFTKPVNLKKFTIYIPGICENSLDSEKWLPVNENQKFDIVWYLSGYFQLPTTKEICKLYCKSEEDEFSFELDLKNHGCELYGVRCQKFEYEFGEGVRDVLKLQLNSCNELLEYENDSKWTLLTAALLMRAVNHQHYHAKSLEYLKKLETVDVLRKGYYEDLASKWKIEKYLEESTTSSEFISNVNLSNLGLTSLFYEQYFTISDAINLSRNRIKDRTLPKLISLQFCKFLNLSYNEITSECSIPELLMKIEIDGNKLSADEIDNITNCFNTKC